VIAAALLFAGHRLTRAGAVGDGFRDLRAGETGQR